jgi:hypothetical protein
MPPVTSHEERKLKTMTFYKIVVFYQAQLERGDFGVILVLKCLGLVGI